MNCKRLAGKCAVNTGGASGIGRTTAMSFGDEGANVAIVDLDREHAQKTAEEVAVKGMSSKVFITDDTSRLEV